MRPRFRTRWLGPIAGACLASLPADGASEVAEVLIARSYVRAQGTPVSVSDAFTACDPAGQFTLVVDNGPGGEPRIASATVRVNGTVVLEESDFGQQVARLERPLAGVGLANVLEVWLGSQPGGTLGVSVLAVQACGPRITSPGPGTLLAATETLVEGRVPSSAGPDDSVTVNGVLAAVAGSRFVARVPVTPETAALTAVLLDAAGRSLGSHTVEVRAGASLADPPVRLVARPGHGVAPLEVRFDLASRVPVARLALDLRGGGSTDFDGPTLADRTFAYGQPGLYLPTVTVTDPAGTTHVATAVLLVEEPGAVTARFRRLWTTFTDRLARGDWPGALALVAPSLQPRLASVIEALEPDLAAIVQGLGPIEVTDQAGDLAEAVVIQPENGAPALHFLYFRRDGLGRWLIEGM